MKLKFIAIAGLFLSMTLSAQDTTGTARKQEPNKKSKTAVKKDKDRALVSEKIAVSDESKPVKKPAKKKAPVKKPALDEK